MNDIYVAGVGMTRLGRLLDKSVYDMVAEAVGLALQDGGCRQSDIQATYYTGTTSGLLQGQYFISGPIAMRRCGFEGIPVYTVENACASGSSVVNLAIQAIRAGSCDIASLVCKFNADELRPASFLWAAPARTPEASGGRVGR